MLLKTKEYNHLHLIAGGPAAPEPTLSIASQSLLTLEWNKPFNWENYTIMHYSIKSNHSSYYSREQTIDDAILSRDITKTESVAKCEVIEFSVKATNELASSPAGSVTGGFPIGEYL